METLTKNQIASVVTECLAKQGVVDMHTHPYPPSFGTPVANSHRRS